MGQLKRFDFRGRVDDNPEILVSIQLFGGMISDVFNVRRI